VTSGRRERSFVAVTVVLSVGYAVLAHAAIIDGVPPALGALLSLVPLAGFALWAGRRSRHRALALALALGAGTALWLGWGTLERHFPSVFFVDHIVINLLLALAFGRTLAGGREPLCTLFARIIHGTLEPDVVRYTRQVTLAWTLFFAVLAALSCTLYLAGFVAAWSLLANILSPLLVGTMFVVEYAIRHRVLPDHKRIGILGGIRAFSRHFGRAQAEASR
jgi:uncharacterized membrane protein